MISCATCLFTGFMIALGWFAGLVFAAFSTHCKITAFVLFHKYRIINVPI